MGNNFPICEVVRGRVTVVLLSEVFSSSNEQVELVNLFLIIDRLKYTIMIRVKYFQTNSTVDSSYLYGDPKIPPLHPTHHLSVFT